MRQAVVRGLSNWVFARFERLTNLRLKSLNEFCTFFMAAVEMAHEVGEATQNVMHVRDVKVSD